MFEEHLRTQYLKISGLHPVEVHLGFPNRVQRMNRELITNSLNKLWLEIEVAIKFGVESDEAFGELRKSFETAKGIAIMSCASYQARDEREIKRIISTRDHSGAINYIREWLITALKAFSPMKVEPRRGSSTILDLIVRNRQARTATDLAEIVSCKYAIMIGLRANSLEALYIEAIVRESLGLPGDLELPREAFADQFMCAELIREIASESSIPAPMTSERGKDLDTLSDYFKDRNMREIA